MFKVFYDLTKELKKANLSITLEVNQYIENNLVLYYSLEDLKTN